jgi:L-lactate dehydrogenase complex protein LldE
MRVSLFITCLTDTLFPETGRATVKILERLGCRVSFPRAQNCCGQLHLNSGYREEARTLADRWSEVFAGAEVVVSPSASCVATLRETVRLGPPLYELTEFITGRLGVLELGSRYPHTVAYHPTCHSQRALGIGDGPLRLLGAVADLELVELPEAEECCGFGGTFAVKNAAVSEAMGEDKVGGVLATQADVVTAVDDSCLMHLEGMLERRRSSVRVAHIAQILAASDQTDQT